MAEKNAQNILVTGGAGYIGSHACKALAALGYTPITYDNLSNGNAWAVKWGPIEHGDLLDRGRLDVVIAKYRPGAVMHFAALAYVGESVTQPKDYYRTNVAGTLSLLEAALHHDIKNFVFSSTCATYGIPDVDLICEQTPQEPINPYGATKLIVEGMLRDFARAYGLRWTALRYFNAAGADFEGEIGEAHDPETHLIPLVLDAASGRRKDITIFGTDYDTEDGTCVRDYIHVVDLADAHVLALKALEAGAENNAFNLGVGKGYSVRQVIETSERMTNLKVPVVQGNRREGDPASLVADASKAREILGWQATRSDLDSIVRSAWNWHKKYNELS